MNITSRSEAKAAGLDRYFTGIPCKWGHVCERYVGGGCIACIERNRKQYRADNAERVRELRRIYDAGRREILNQQSYEWRRRNPGKAKTALSKWRQKNKERVAAYELGRRSKKSESLRRRRRERAGDPIFALQGAVRSRVGSAFRRRGYEKNSKTAQIIGCSWPELKRHIERQFLKGMTWGNRGVAWHIDHIRPLAEARTVEDAQALCHFTNLRPLWAKDNHKKHAKRLHLI